MSGQELKIGQVIYIVSDKSGKILPAIVSEEVTIKTLEGNSTSWKLFVGSPTNRQVIDSKQVAGEIYSSLEDVHNLLFDRLNSFLTETINETKERAKKWYGVYFDDSGKIDPTASMLDSSGKIDTDQLLETVDQEPSEPNKQQVIKQAKQTVGPKKQKSPKERLREAFGSDIEQPIQTTEQLTSSSNQKEDLSNVPIGATIKRKQKVNGEIVDVEYLRTEEGFELVL